MKKKKKMGAIFATALLSPTEEKPLAAVPHFQRLETLAALFRGRGSLGTPAYIVFNIGLTGTT
jgi:hypothetical protein